MDDYNKRMKEWIAKMVKEELSENDDSDIENQSQLSEKAKRDYKDEYKKFQSSPKAKKYRAELNKYNRKKGTYGNGDGKDASHKGGKIVGFEAQSKNRGRAEKSRLKKESVIKENLMQFYKYMGEFYGKKGIYPDKKGRDLKVGDINKALSVYLKKYAKDEFTGDSLDRERVRDILIKMKKIDPQYKKQEVKENKDKVKKYMISKGDTEEDATEKLKYYDYIKKTYKGITPARMADIMGHLTKMESVNEKMRPAVKKLLKQKGYSPIFQAIDNSKRQFKQMRYSRGEIQDTLIDMFGDEDPKILQKIKESVNEKKNQMYPSKLVDVGVKIAKLMRGNMTGAVKKIEKLRKGLSKNGRVQYALRQANESVNEDVYAIVDKFNQKKQDYDQVYFKDNNLNKVKKHMKKMGKKYGKMNLIKVKTNGKMSLVESVSKSQAQEIMRQLGGRKFEMLMGVKSKGVGKDGLIIHIGRNPKKVSHIIIDIDRGKDLYNLTFGKIFKYQFKVIKKLKGIYVDQLHDMIEKYTGLLTTFRKR